MTVRVDFTPMVDMLMLLITFFMLCTSLSKPSTMELTMPSNDKNTHEAQKNEAKESHSITIYLTDGNKIFYGNGKPEYDNANWLKHEESNQQHKHIHHRRKVYADGHLLLLAAFFSCIHHFHTLISLLVSCLFIKASC